MSFCNSCGTQLEPNVAFCVKCGNKTEGASGASPQAQPATPPPGVTVNPSPAVEKMKNLAGGLNAGMVKGIIMTLVVLVAGLMFTGWLTLREDSIIPNAQTIRTNPHSLTAPMARDHRNWERNQTNPQNIQNRRDREAPMLGLHTASTIVLIGSVAGVLVLAVFMFLLSQKHAMAVNAGLVGFAICALMSIIFIIYMLANGSDIGSYFVGALGSARPSIFAVGTLLLSLAGGALTFLKKSELKS